jgi:hypothetical protein
MAQQESKARGQHEGNQLASLEDPNLPNNGAEDVRDVMARFDQIGFDDCEPSANKHRRPQAKKN